MPITPSPPPLPDKSNSLHSKTASSKSTRSSCPSDLHLGLGHFETALQLPFGPSPPPSPLVSPKQRAATTARYRTKPLPLSPLSPITPSRAPRKAAALLGASGTASSYRNGTKSSGSSGKVGKKALDGKHYRPLPGSILVEIERFFGDVPKKHKTPPGLKAKRPVPRNGPSAIDNPVGERKVGEGNTVRHNDDEGRMWLDVEEEQEFAWLMSDQPSLSLPLSIPGLSDSDLPTDEGEEDDWEMERFTSVLSLDKPKKREKGNRHKAEKVLGIQRGAVEKSWLDLEMDNPANTRTSRAERAERKRTVSDEMEYYPWRFKALNKVGTTLSGSLPSMPSLPSLVGRSVSPARVQDELALIDPPPRLSSRTASPSPTRAPSPPRVKNRPPPLTLVGGKPKSNLPILTATTPNNSRKGKSNHSTTSSLPKSRPFHRSRVPSSPRPLPASKAPSTPFVHPRPAPFPRSNGIPPVPPVPAPPAFHAMIRTKPNLAAIMNPDIQVLGAPAQSELGIENSQEQVSWFEPITPTNPSRLAYQKVGNVDSRKVSGGSGWFKKVVKPLGSRV